MRIVGVLVLASLTACADLSPPSDWAYLYKKDPLTDKTHDQAFVFGTHDTEPEGDYYDSTLTAECDGGKFQVSLYSRSLNAPYDFDAAAMLPVSVRYRFDQGALVEDMWVGETVYTLNVPEDKALEFVHGASNTKRLIIEINITTFYAGTNIVQYKRQDRWTFPTEGGADALGKVLSACRLPVKPSAEFRPTPSS